MRVTFVILIFIGLIGIINPAFFIAEGSGGGRWVFIVIFLLGAFKMWAAIKKNKRYDG
ncbi:hypothetical protein ME1_01290 [Bartonella vinsonii subsp. arupensis OK-94-513]|uniref:Uncharacterized protein n=2 Tax=Bartonella vinsonii subsp. arupensis TaxID=110578 RepID=J0QV86_BARVI|nr:hypothetical protein [Bartonella vinsonii]EJF87059.1 hypothetical protein ME1_01290 [Bartonella vinsonii subsp. arupensis OK-94-513]EJF98769.1 hypothetical protein MEI_00339 [Bartonella vinsonii subsp. arupensis Pm136co]